MAVVNSGQMLYLQRLTVVFQWFRGSHELSVPCLQWNICVSNYQFRESQIQLNNKLKNKKSLFLIQFLKIPLFIFCYLDLISEKQIEN